MHRKGLLAAAFVLAAAACSGPRMRQPAIGAKPGWGRVASPAEGELTVRAVPASAAPEMPELRIGRPGWGRPVPER